MNSVLAQDTTPASYGFMVIAIDPMTQEGERTRDRSTSSQMIDAINWAMQK